MSIERQVDENNAAVEDQEEDAEEEYASEGGSFADTLALIPGWLVSMVAHLCIFVTMALINFDTTSKAPPTEIVSNPVEEAEEIEEELEEPPEEINLDPDAEISEEVEATTEVSVSETDVNISPADDMTAAAVSVDLVDISSSVAPRNALGNVVGAYSGDAFSGRGSGKARALAMGGGTTESERAVALGLQWIANHQMPNGSWSYNHQMAPSCRGACKDPGKLNAALNGATGLALLPFLGAGVTHKEGKYKKAVYGGLQFLAAHGKPTRDGNVSYLENGGTIYSHGIVAICLSEAYAMTKDKKLLPAAQGALNYICFHQDPAGGGWRYSPKQAGDTSAVGWQLMALKSGYMAGLRVPNQTISKATRFLDSVQVESGAKYGYTDPGAGHATTAVGLLARMYLGWKHDNPALQRGAEWLSKIGPSKNDSYYNYYATQVMRQYDGPLWKKWNAVMRDQMVNSQAQQGHEKGSWYHKGAWSERGGRLYDTALSTMVLEVYYRHMPIYKAAAAADGFPLD